MNILKIIIKVLNKKNHGNQAFLLCIAILMLLSTFLYNISSSVAKQVETSQKEVFGGFSDILYEPTQYHIKSFNVIQKDTSDFLDGFSAEDMGSLSTVYSEEINESRKLNVGYADVIGIQLAAVKIIDGHLPEKSGEIALTNSIAQYFSVGSLENKVIIAGAEYTVCGIVADFGRLWVHGEIQEKQNVSPINAFLTQSDAALLFEKTQTLTRQILLIQSLDNIIVKVEKLYHFKNTNISDITKFEIPTQFRIIVLTISFAVILLTLVLNKNKLTKRIENYYRLGLAQKETRLILCLEYFVSFIFGTLLGGLLSFLVTNLSICGISYYINQPIQPIIDISSFYINFIILFIGTSLIIYLFLLYTSKQAIKIVHAERIGKTKKITFKKRFSYNFFSFKKYSKNYSLLILLVVFSYTFVSYSIFYGNYIRRDITVGAPGMLPRDCDFQFVTRTMNAAPWSEQNDPVVFFTDTYEKLGVKDAFINKLLSDKMVSSVKVYRENNKYAVLLDNNQIDNYIDASDFFIDRKYNTSNILSYSFMDTNSRVHLDKFGYDKSTLLVASEILGYPDDVLKTLERSVVEGKIDIQKIKSGEEVILRVPAFKIEAFSDGSTAMERTEPSDERAYNCNVLKVGDEVTLTALVTNEMINGAVPESYLDKYRRVDTTVKIGAIIRNTDGILCSNGTTGRTFSFLTVNEAFEKLGINADYSIVSIYGSSEYSDSQLIEHFSEYTKDITQSGGNMVFENWISDMKTNKSYNLMIDVFIITLITVLIIAMFIILTSQFYNLTQFSVKNYTLLRLNGLPLRDIIKLHFWEALIISVIGGLIGILITLLLIRFVGINASDDMIKILNYYFPLKNLVFVFVGVLVLSLLSVLPSVFSICKNRNNVI